MTEDFVVRVVSNERIARDVHDIVMELSSAAEDISPMPGQFAHIASPDAFMRRPISIAGYERDNRRVRFIVRAAGRGTAAITSMSRGESTKALMPLGTPFPMESAIGANVWLVGGGIGTAPLIYAAWSLFKTGRSKIKSFLGFRDERDIFGKRELGTFGGASVNTGGFVTDLVKSALTAEKPDVIFSCGPGPMLVSLQEICRRENVKAYASLEARMGCGVGACLVCNCEIKGKRAEYRRVCRDGPVFDIAEVILS